MYRVVVAPNAFKESLSADAAAEAMCTGVLEAIPDSECIALPIADGGDGSVDAFVRAGFARRPVTVRGPTGAAVQSSTAMRGTTAVVELADACGLSRLPGGQPAPMTSSTEGLGDALRAALDSGALDVVVCLGGSASTDGGSGLLSALGARLVDAHGHEVQPSGEGLPEIAALDLSGLDGRLQEARLTIAADVDAPLLGPRGAAAVFAPQKGAGPAQVAQLESGLSHWCAVLEESTGAAVRDVRGSGAAGGTAAALLAIGARVLPGAEVIAEVVGLPAAFEDADVVITGEGRLDHQTSMGKGAAWIARLARQAGCQVLAVCGRIDVDDDQMRELGFSAWADCLSRASDENESRTHADRLVVAATRDTLRALAAGEKPGA